MQQENERTQRPNRFLVFTLMITMLGALLYGVTLLGYATSDESSFELIKATNNAADLIGLFKILEKMEVTVDEEAITIMMETDRQNIVDVLRILKYGFEGAGGLFAGASIAFAELLEKSRMDPHLFDDMTREQLICLMKGTITFDSDFFNLTVQPEGVVKLRSAKNYRQLNDDMRHSFDEKRDVLLIIKTLAQKLRSLLLAKMDTEHVAQVTHIGNFSGWLHATFSHNVTAELFRMMETFARFLRFTYIVHIEAEQIKGKTYSTACLSWTIKMWTGYGISVIPLLVYSLFAFYFLFKGTIINGIYQEILRRYSTRRWCLYMKMMVKDMFLVQKTQETDENGILRTTRTKWPLLLHLFIYFMASNIIFMTISWVLFYGYGKTRLSDRLYAEVADRVNVKDIFEEEIFNISTVYNLIVLIFTLLVEIFFNWIVRVGLVRLDHWLFTYRATPGTAANARIYDGIVTRMSIATYVRLLIKPNELYSWIWKFLGFQLIEFLLLKYIGIPLPVDAHMNEVSGMVAWVASVWSVKSLH